MPVPFESESAIAFDCGVDTGVGPLVLAGIGDVIFCVYLWTLVVGQMFALLKVALDLQKQWMALGVWMRKNKFGLWEPPSCSQLPC